MRATGVEARPGAEHGGYEGPARSFVLGGVEIEIGIIDSSSRVAEKLRELISAGSVGALRGLIEDLTTTTNVDANQERKIIAAQEEVVGSQSGCILCLKENAGGGEVVTSRGEGLEWMLLSRVPGGSTIVHTVPGTNGAVCSPRSASLRPLHPQLRPQTRIAIPSDAFPTSTNLELDAASQRAWVAPLCLCLRHICVPQC
jgi:hypothetical protein